MDKYSKLEHDLITTDNTHIAINNDSFAFNAPHDYEILSVNTNKELCKIHFQQGGVKEAG